MPNTSKSFSAAAGARVPGARLARARYTLKRMLGRGGFSDVWLAWDRTREEDVVLKFLPEPLLKSTPFIELLQREIQRAAKLEHPAIVRIFDFVQDRENLGVAMEYVEGWSLAVLKIDRPQKRYSFEEIRPWIWQLCTALEYAHSELGLVHGDLRPANLFLNPREQLRVADFALNPIIHAALAQPGYLASGALPYLSPQQAKGALPGALDDIYSLGATIYDLLTGTPPFFKDDILAQAAEAVPPPMTGRLVQLQIDGGFPQSWDETIAACLAKAPADRPQSVAQVRQRLEPTVASGPLIKKEASPRIAQIDANSGKSKTKVDPLIAPIPELVPEKAVISPPVGGVTLADASLGISGTAVLPAVAEAETADTALSAVQPPASASSATPLPGAVPALAPSTLPEVQPPLAPGSSRKPRSLSRTVALLALVAGGIWLLVAARNFISSGKKNQGSVVAAPKAGLPGSLDSSFEPGVGADDQIRSVAAQPDGKLLVGGRFSYFDESVLKGLARLNPDGSPERTFAPDVGGTVHAIALQPDGKILLGGDFTNVKGQTRLRVARLNADGTLDTTFDAHGAANREVRSMLVQPDGKILAGGSFTGGGNLHNRLTRLNPDGTKDTTFNIGAGANRIVWALALQPDAKILVAGDFTTFDDRPQGRIVRLNPDGSLDKTFALSPGANHAILALSRLPDGKILIAGDFTRINDSTSMHIARLLPDGMPDSSFKPGLGADGSVRSIKVQPDRKILIAGSFRSVQGVPRNGIARLKPDGSLDQEFAPPEAVGGADCWWVTLQPDGKVIIAGGFTNFNGTACGRIARLYAAKEQ